MEITKEMLECSRKAKNVKELHEMAEAMGVTLSESQAHMFFEKQNPPVGELTDAELENVSGGGCANTQVGETNSTTEEITLPDVGKVVENSNKGMIA